MSNNLFADTFAMREMAPHWRRVALILIGLSILHGGLSVLEQISIMYMDYWIPLTSMEEAEWYSIAISQTAELIRFLLVGVAVLLTIRVVASPGAGSPPARFLSFWSLVSLFLAVALLALDTVGYNLQFGGIAMDGETFRTYFLLLMYAKVVVYYLSLRLLFGAGKYSRGRPMGLRSAWTATSTIGSLLLFAAFLAIKLSIEGVIIPIVSYVPVVAPFWFVADELAPHRYVVGQGTRIFSEALGLSLYVLAWVSSVGRTAIGVAMAIADSTVTEASP